MLMDIRPLTPASHDPDGDLTHTRLNFRQEISRRFSLESKFIIQMLQDAAPDALMPRPASVHLLFGDQDSRTNLEQYARPVGTLGTSPTASPNPRAMKIEQNLHR